MSKIQWTNLPPALRDHLFERIRERKITAEALYQLKSEDTLLVSGSTTTRAYARVAGIIGNDNRGPSLLDLRAHRRIERHPIDVSPAGRAPHSGQSSISVASHSRPRPCRHLSRLAAR